MKKENTKKVKSITKKKTTSNKASFSRTSDKPKTTKKVASKKVTTKTTKVTKKVTPTKVNSKGSLSERLRNDPEYIKSLKLDNYTRSVISNDEKATKTASKDINKERYNSDFEEFIRKDLKEKVVFKDKTLEKTDKTEKADKTVKSEKAEKTEKINKKIKVEKPKKVKKVKKHRERKAHELKLPKFNFVKNAFFKNCLRLISSTKSRFISLLLITLIGSSFLMGLSSVSPIMEYTMDSFDDESNLQDIQIYSNYGFTEENFDAIKTIDGVLDVEGSKFFDCYGIFDDNSRKTLRVQELNGGIGTLTLREGRMPENDYECVALYSDHASKNLSIGSALYLIKDTDEELDSVISNRVFTIVGLVETPQYITFSSESSTFHNLNLDDVIFVNDDLFLSSYYTCAYVTVDGAVDYNAFSDEYENFINYYDYRLNILSETEKDVNRAEIIAAAQEELDAAQAQLDAQKKSGQYQLDAAKAQLDAAYAKLLTGSATIEATENVIDTLTDNLTAQQIKINSQGSYVNSTINQIQNAYGKSFEEVLTNMSALYAVYNGLDYNKIDPYIISYRDSVQKDFDDYNAQLTDNLAKQDEIEEKLSEIVDEISITISSSLDKQYGDDSEESESTPDIDFDIDIEGLTEEKEELIEELTELKKDELLLNIKVEIAEKEVEVINNRDEAAIKSLIDALKMDITNLSGVSSIPDTYNNLIKLKTAQIQLDTSNQLLNETRKQIEENEDSLEEGKQQVESGTAEYKSALAKYNSSVATFNTSVSDAQAQLDKAEQDLNELSEGWWKILDRTSHVSSVMYGNSAEQMGTIGTAIPVMFFLVAILVCMTTMTRLIDEQRGQIGCLLALGFSNGKILFEFVFYAFVASMVGSLIGVFAGVYTLPKIIYSIWQLSYRLPEMRFYFPIKNALISVFSFVILMCTVTFIVVRNNLKDCPASLLRPKAPKKTRKAAIEKVKFIWDKLSFTSRITVRNIFRYKQRFFMTIIGIAGCVALLILGLGIQDSVSRVPTHFGSILKYNNALEISDGEYSDSMIEYLNEKIGDCNAVSALNYNSAVTLNEEEDTFKVYVVDKEDADTLFTINDFYTEKPIELDDSGVIISCKYAEHNDLAVGDTLIMESSDGVKREVKISGIFVCYVYDNIIMSDAYYNEVFGVEANHNHVYFTYGGDTTSLYDGLTYQAGYVSVAGTAKTASAFAELVSSLNLIVLIVVVFAGMLAFVVLINLTEVNISERKREIATLKVLGFNKIEVRNYIFKELIILTIVGSIIGIPLGYLAHSYLISIINYNMVFIPTIVDFSSVVVSIILTYIFLVIILIIEARPISKVKMVESLKSVE